MTNGAVIFLPSFEVKQLDTYLFYLFIFKISFILLIFKFYFGRQ